MSNPTQMRVTIDYTAKRKAKWVELFAQTGESLRHIANWSPTVGLHSLKVGSDGAVTTEYRAAPPEALAAIALAAWNQGT